MNKKLVDFSQHIHTVEKYKCGEKEIRVDCLKKEGTWMGYVQFVNSEYGMSVFGDYSEWIFTRPFIPSPNGSSDTSYYWRSKLVNYDKLKSFDADGAQIYIQKMIEEWEYYVDDNGKEEFIEMLNDIDCFDEFTYVVGLREIFDKFNICSENFKVPSDLDIHFYIIGEAFDEICKRLKEETNES